MAFLRIASFHLNLTPSPPKTAPLQPLEVFVDDETKLTLHGLKQYYVKLKESEKNRKLFDLLDLLEFNQVLSSLIYTNLYEGPMKYL